MNKRRLSIKNALLLMFALTFLIIGAVMTSIVFTNWSRSANETAQRIATDISEDIYNRIDSFMSVPIDNNEAGAALIQQEIVNLDDASERERYFVSMLSSSLGDVAYSFSYGTETGEYYGARKNASGIIEIMINNSDTGGYSWYYEVTDDLTAGDRVLVAGLFDVTSRPWYQAAKEAEGTVFSPIYKHFVMPDLTISAAIAIEDDMGNIVGVLGTHVILSRLNLFLEDIMETTEANSIIVEKETGNIIANSMGFDNYTLIDGTTFQRLNIDDSDQQAFSEAYHMFIDEEITNTSLEHDNESCYFNIGQYTESGVDWLIISAVPEDLFLGVVHKNMIITITLASFYILLAIGIYLLVVNRLFKPLAELNKATKGFSNGHFGERVKIYSDNEIGRISDSFNQMADTIESFVATLEGKVNTRTSELKVVNESLNESREKLRLILDTTAEGIFGIDKRGTCTFINNSAVELLGVAPDRDAVGKDVDELISRCGIDGNQIDSAKALLLEAFTEESGIHHEDLAIGRIDGTCIHISFHAYPQYLHDEVIGVVVSFIDVTDSIRKQEEIRRISIQDYLTGLYNRRYYSEVLHALDKEHKYPLGIMMIDMNGLKVINDAYGHAAGDEALVKIAKILSSSVKPEGVVARIGGDEFAIVYPNTSKEEMEQLIKTILDQLEKAEVENIRLSISMGYDLKTTERTELREVTNIAENMMYKKKLVEGKQARIKAVESILDTLTARYKHELEHSKKVSWLAKAIGEAMDLDENSLRKLELAGLYHDIGKVGVPEEIILAPRKLTETEFDIIKAHTRYGYQILRSADEYANFADEALYHHEHYDGKGYPEGLKGKDIPIFARILCVADAFAAMTTEKPYKAKMSLDEAIKELKKYANSQFDPEIVKIFIEKILGGKLYS
ncbi:MAG: diguanylate cyclase [Bacilli bacterium]|nr:diguanylate cyclase [Bacilli bacterium]